MWCREVLCQCCTHCLPHAMLHVYLGGDDSIYVNGCMVLGNGSPQIVMGCMKGAVIGQRRGCALMESIQLRHFMLPLVFPESGLDLEVLVLEV